MKNFKSLYTFDIPKTEEVEESIKETNDKGEEITVSKKVKKESLIKAALRKPTRSLSDEAEVYYSALVGKGIQAGLLSRALLAKRFSNDGGILSEPDKAKYSETFYEYEEKLREQTHLSAKLSLSEEEQERLKEITKSIGLLQRELQDFEINQMSLFDITAESRARTKTIFWWLLNLTYILKKENDNPKDHEWEPLFKGDTLEEKMDEYDRINESEDFSETERDFYFRIIRRAMAAIAYWFYGKASTQADFETLETEIEKDFEKK